ncbi:MAG: type II toxin-antitoxin system PemK/MazF family toxin [candidate division WOR-3 bacterium]|nr:type II toxin-antitoxin system PemK/MazF family toxin [candidate division WOR-3 bacterium]
MASYAAGDVVLLEFPFTGTAGSKRRPALILLDTGDDDIVVARVTGQLSAAPQDVTLDEWQQAGLLLPSVVRLHKIATLQRRLVDKKLGRLTPGDWSRVVLILRQVCRSL